MAKKLLVRTPQTTDGVNLLYDENKQVVYKDSIVETAARQNFESLNSRLPDHLKYSISEVEVEDEPGQEVAALLKKIEELESANKVDELKARIAELEDELKKRKAKK